MEDDAVRKMKGEKAPRKIHTLLLFLGNPKKLHWPVGEGRFDFNVAKKSKRGTTLLSNMGNIQGIIIMDSVRNGEDKWLRKEQAPYKS